MYNEPSFRFKRWSICIFIYLMCNFKFDSCVFCMCMWIIIVSVRQRRMLFHYFIQHCIQIVDSFVTFSISNSKKTLYRYDFAHTLEYLQITCTSASSRYGILQLDRSGESCKEWDNSSMTVCCFIVVHIFVYCRMHLGYNRLLVYFFPKSSTFGAWSKLNIPLC